MNKTVKYTILTLAMMALGKSAAATQNSGPKPAPKKSNKEFALKAGAIVALQDQAVPIATRLPASSWVGWSMAGEYHWRPGIFGLNLGAEFSHLNQPGTAYPAPNIGLSPRYFHHKQNTLFFTFGPDLYIWNFRLGVALKVGYGVSNYYDPGIVLGTSVELAYRLNKNWELFVNWINTTPPANFDQKVGGGHLEFGNTPASQIGFGAAFTFNAGNRR